MQKTKPKYYFQGLPSLKRGGEPENNGKVTSPYYYPQLDSIRGLSFLAVFFYHAYHPTFGIGLLSQFFKYIYANLDLSIDVFFILSSFLLTWLGINEFRKKGNFSFKNYFIRRALRIWPLYYLIMLFSFIVLPIVAQRMGIHVTLPPAAYYLFFVSNYYSGGHVYFLQFLWTLSVEEQFYLVWGFCLLVFQRYLKIVCLIFILISLGFTFYATAKNLPSYFNTLTYLFDFAMGSLAAILVKKNSRIILFFKNISKSNTILFYCFLPALFIICFFASSYSTGTTQDFILLFTRLIFIVYTALVIIEQMVNKSTVLKLGNSNFLVYTGKISYGLYCFHGIVLTFGGFLAAKVHLNNFPFLQAVVFLILNYLIAAISYTLIETPFLKLKSKLRRV
jgi:peptidoglycan/LPS O-acetylase OafA/YrhL